MVVAVEDFPILNHHQSQDTLPETNIDNSSPLKIDHLEVRRFLLETAIFRDEHLSFREGSHETLPTFFVEESEPQTIHQKKVTQL